MRELGTCLVIIVLTIAGFLAGSGQSLASTESQEAGPASVEIEPSSLALEVGDKVQIRAVVKDVGGKILPDAQVIFFSLNRVAVGVTPPGSVEAHRPGQYRVAALSPEKPFEGEPDYYSTSDPGIRATIPVTVAVPPLESLEFVDLRSTLYAGTTVPVAVTGTDVSQAKRDDVRAAFRISDPTVARTDGFGHLSRR